MNGTSTVNLQRPAPFRLRADEAEALTGGRWSGTPREVTLRGAAIDSRRVSPGCVFACLAGERADGHDFAAAAAASGASLILASHAVRVPVPVLLVKDVAQALRELAAAFRARHGEVRWIGIAGANGKTTTKELVAAAIRAGCREPVLVTSGNLNNHLGVPLTVLSLPDRARFAVIEMGSNHPGELAQLCAVVRPDLGCVVSIGPEHLEGFTDLAGVAREECALFTALPAAAPAFLGTHALATQAEANATTAEALLAIARSAAADRDLRLSAEPTATAGTGEILTTPAGSAQLALLGTHNRANAWLAWQVAVAAGIDGRAALNGIASVRAAPGRLRPVACAGHLLIDDSYNANPASMQAGLNVLAARPGRRLAILGHMGELGEASAHGHAQVGTLAARLGVALIAVGPLALPIHAAYRAAGGADGQHVPDHAGTISAANAWLAAGTASVLIKGSRSAHLEVVVAGICTAHGARAPGGVH